MCTADRALVEQQRALAASSLTSVPCIDALPCELHGSLADLAQQLHECVQQRRQAHGEGRSRSVQFM